VVTRDNVPVSPDGRFEWDGRRWVATREQRRRSLMMAFGIVTSILVFTLGLMLLVLAPAIIALIEVFR
jgi:hypothetical protein